MVVMLRSSWVLVLCALPCLTAMSPPASPASTPSTPHRHGDVGRYWQRAPVPDNSSSLAPPGKPVGTNSLVATLDCQTCPPGATTPMPLLGNGTGGEEEEGEGGNKTVYGPMCGPGEKALRRWQGYMNLVCVPLLTLLGVTGNVLSFLVMGSPVYRRKSYSYYLRTLAVFDTLTLLTEAIIMSNDISLEFGHSPFLHLHTPLTCKLTNFLESVVFLMSSWVLVAFTCDRYVAVCHPLQRARLCTDTRAKVIVAILLVLAMLTQVFRFFYMDHLPGRHKVCHSPVHLRLTYMGVHYFWYGFFLRFAVPFLILLTCNSLIIFHVHRMHKRRQAAAVDEREKRRRTHLAIGTLLVVCAVFVITLFPNAMIALYMFVKGLDIQTYCVLIKLDPPFQIIRLLNYSTNFVLYGMTGRLFRSELHRLLTCRRYTSSPNSSKKIKVKVNFQALGSRLPVLVATPVESYPQAAGRGGGTQERKLYLGRFDRERESVL